MPRSSGVVRPFAADCVGPRDHIANQIMLHGDVQSLVACGLFIPESPLKPAQMHAVKVEMIHRFELAASLHL